MPNTAEDILVDGLRRLRALLAEADVRFELESVPAPGPHDAVLLLPDLNRRVLIQAKVAAHPKDLDAPIPLGHGLQGSIPLLIVRRASRPLFERCRQAGMCLLDAEGNAFLKLPGVYVERYSASKPPPRPPVAGTVFTARSSRIVAALLADPAKAWSQAELGRATGVSPGYVSTRVRLLQEQGYVRSRIGALRVAEPDRLLDDWATFYRFDRHRQSRFAISMSTYDQGITKLTAELGRCGIVFAHTGWTGAFLRAPYGTSTVLMTYVDRVPSAGETKLIYPTASEGNVILLLPHDDGVFRFTTDCGGQGRVVSDAQLYVDLMKMPGRAREQADALRERRLDFSEIREAR